MDKSKIAEMKKKIELEYKVGCNLPELGKSIEHKFIFGPYANNEHYNIDDIMSVVREVELEKNPPVVEENL